MRTKLRLGEMLIQEGLLTEQQLERALTAKRGSGLKLGQFLVRNNICPEDSIVDMLSRQLRIDRYDPSRYQVDSSLSDIITSDQAREYNAVPLARSGRLLRVATPDPLNLESQDALEVITGLEIEPVVCTESDFEQIFSSLYGMYWNIDDVLEDVEHGELSVEDQQGTGGDTQDVHTLEEEADQGPVIKLLNSILAQAVKQGASDVHLSPEKDRVQARFRVDGKLREVPAPPLNMMSSIVSRIKVLAGMDISVSRMPQDGRFTVGMKGREIHVRASCIPTIHGENVVLRLLDLSARTFELEELGMNSEDYRKMSEAIATPYGMILASGPTGSGKSTSLYAILRRINQPDINIITLEDPVEYRVQGVRQVQLNTRAGMTFASGLRSILRQDPDVIMVGEMRDAETARIGVQAAMTGHRVLSTLHTNDAAGAVARFIDMGIEPYLVSSVLVVSFAQRLMRKNCSKCARPYTPSDKALKAIGLENSADCTFMQGQGCYSCMNTGFSGRTAAFEVLRVDDEVREMIQAGTTGTRMGRQLSQSGKLHDLRSDAAAKVCRGLTTVEEAMTVVMT